MKHILICIGLGVMTNMCLSSSTPLGMVHPTPRVVETLSTDVWTGKDLCEDSLSAICLEEDSICGNWQSLYRMGCLYKEKGNSLQALSCFTQAYHLHSSDTLRKEIAETYYERGYYRECIEMLRPLLSDSGMTDWNLAAKSYEKLGITDTAIMLQKVIANKDILNYKNLISLAQNLLTIQENDIALQFINAYTNIDSTNLSVNGLKAYILYRQGEYSKALYGYQKLKAMGDDLVSTNYYLGLSYAQNDSLGRAYDCLAHAAEQSKRQNPHILAQLGIISIKIGFTQEGIHNIDSAIELLQPDKSMMVSLYNAQASAYLQIRKYTEAIAKFKASLSYNPNQLRLYYQLAYLYGLQKDTANECRYCRLFIDKATTNNQLDTYPLLIEAAKQRLKDAEKAITIERFFKGETKE